MRDLAQKIRAQIDLDEQWALAASSSKGGVELTGVHWQWVTGENWDPVRPDPVTMEFLEGPDGSWAANLATVEEWHVTHERMTVRTYADSINEMDPAAAGHIIRHDPARVLRQVKAHRAILDRHGAQSQPDDESMLQALAYIYFGEEDG